MYYHKVWSFVELCVEPIYSKVQPELAKLIFGLLSAFSKETSCFVLNLKNRRLI